MATFTVILKVTNPETGEHHTLDITCDLFSGPDEIGLVRFCDETPGGLKLVNLLDWDSMVGVQRHPDPETEAPPARMATSKARTQKPVADVETEPVGAGATS